MTDDDADVDEGLDILGDEEVSFVDDVEEALDEALAARLDGGLSGDAFEDEDDEDDTFGPEGSADDVPLRRPDEFLCRGCFLLKRASQLAEPSAQLCRDCA